LHPLARLMALSFGGPLGARTLKIEISHDENSASDIWPPACFISGTACLPAARPIRPSKPFTPPCQSGPPREFGGKMPLPVDQRIERQTIPSDRLLVEVTRSVKGGAPSYAAT